MFRMWWGEALLIFGLVVGRGFRVWGKGLMFRVWGSS